MNSRSSILIGAVVVILVIGAFFVLTNSKSTIDVSNPDSYKLIIPITPAEPISVESTSTPASASTSIQAASSTTITSTSTASTTENSNSTSTVFAVSYTDTGFSPATIQIYKGQTIRFTNNSSSSMWVASDPYPNNTAYAAFNQNKGVATGGAYTFTFDKTGTWGYHDNLHPEFKGTVIVQ